MTVDRTHCCVCAKQGKKSRTAFLTPEMRLPLCRDDAHDFWKHMDEARIARQVGTLDQWRRRSNRINGMIGARAVRQAALNQVLGTSQRLVYMEIKKHVEEHGAFPQIAEIADKVAIRRTNVWTLVSRLERHGFVTRVGNEIRPVNRAQAV